MSDTTATVPAADATAVVHQNAAECYDRMAKIHVADFTSSETPFRHFNNFVKRVLIQKALDHCRSLSRSVTSPSTQLAVLDLASGRGGDLFKWQHAQSPKLGTFAARSVKPKDATRCEEYFCFDISPESIKSAQERDRSRSEEQQAALRCSFEVANCFDASFLQNPGRLRQLERFGFFSVVSVQFAFHYACASRDSMRMVLASIFEALRPGGIFIATIVDSEEVCRRMTQRRADGASPSRNNVVKGKKFTITFPSNDDSRESETLRPVLGTPYHFLLDDFVDCEEFFVPIEDLRQVATEVGFGMDVGVPFSSYVSTYRVETKNPLPLNEDDLDLITIYRTVVLVRPSPELEQAKPVVAARFSRDFSFR